jgi:hypothetical protein
MWVNAMKIIKFISQSPNKTFCEDVIGSSENIFWLMDGATPPKDMGRVTHDFVNAMSANLGQACLSLSVSPLKEIAREVLQRTFTEEEVKPQESYVPSSTLIMVRINEGAIEYLVLGDSFLVIHHDDTQEIISDDRLMICACEERDILKEIAADQANRKEAKYAHPHGAADVMSSPCGHRGQVVFL